MPAPAIEFANVSKSFRHGRGEPKLLRAHLTDWFRRRGRQEFFALRDVSFRVEEGESVAIVGRNGAGKSTLLGLVAGLTAPAKGKVVVRGRAAALLERGAGVHPDLTGVENLRLNASLLGMSRKRTEEMFHRITAFADIGDFIFEPLRTYSMGMSMRLAFAVAIHVDPDILIIDEVLAVGDQAFQEKCRERIRAFQDEGKTLLFVSHSGAAVQELCTRAIWLDHGRVVMDGAAAEVLAGYAAGDAGHGAAG
jgi:ABC-type polysaccharide/polyol phosphate transport system ATPase subunit